MALGGGADLIRQGLTAGVVDELAISTAPVVLGGGKRLFEGFEKDLELEVLGVWNSPYATHVRYAVKRPATGVRHAVTTAPVAPRRDAEDREERVSPGPLGQGEADAGQREREGGAEGVGDRERRGVEAAVARRWRRRASPRRCGG